MFTNNQEEEKVKHTPIRFADHTERDRVADILQGRAAIQSRNLTPNKGKCRVLLLGWTNSDVGTGWGLIGWRDPGSSRLQTLLFIEIYGRRTQHSVIN